MGWSCGGEERVCRGREAGDWEGASWLAWARFADVFGLGREVEGGAGGVGSKGSSSGSSGGDSAAGMMKPKSTSPTLCRLEGCQSRVRRKRGRKVGAYAAPRMRSRMRSCPGRCQRVRSAVMEGIGHVDILVAIAYVVLTIHQESLHFHEVRVDECWICWVCSWQSEGATMQQ